jgi:hypothetical protein
MTTAALITMVLTMSVVTIFVTYFFLRVLKSPLKKDGDSDR